MNPRRKARLRRWQRWVKEPVKPLSHDPKDFQYFTEPSLWSRYYSPVYAAYLAARLTPRSAAAARASEARNT